MHLSSREIFKHSSIRWIRRSQRHMANCGVIMEQLYVVVPECCIHRRYYGVIRHNTGSFRLNGPVDDVFMSKLIRTRGLGSLVHVDGFRSVVPEWYETGHDDPPPKTPITFHFVDQRGHAKFNKELKMWSMSSIVHKALQTICIVTAVQSYTISKPIFSGSGPNPKGQRDVIRGLYQRTFEQMKTTCDTVERLGSTGDGGKFVCIDDIPEQHCVVYSLGSDGDFSFELDLLNHRPNCDVYTFDCTKPITPPKGVHFYPWCIGSQNRGKYQTINTIMNKLKHTTISHS